MAKRYRATTTNIENYWQLFVNRRAYVLQSKRPHSDSGRYYYFRPKAGPEGQAISLSAETIRRHLEGDITIGLYSVNPGTQRCKWIAMDGDYADSLKHLCELQWELQKQRVESALEQSRRGAHLWVFAEQPLLARECRLLISSLSRKLGIPVKGAGTAEGIEIFPKHDELKDGDFGNAIRGPLGIHRAISARFWFYGADYNLDNQLAYLGGLGKLSGERNFRSFSRNWGLQVLPRRCNRNACICRTQCSNGSSTFSITSRFEGSLGETGSPDAPLVLQPAVTRVETTWRSPSKSPKSISAGPIAPRK